MTYEQRQQLRDKLKAYSLQLDEARQTLQSAATPEEKNQELTRFLALTDKHLDVLNAYIGGIRGDLQ